MYVPKFHFKKKKKCLKCDENFDQKEINPKALLHSLSLADSFSVLASVDPKFSNLSFWLEKDTYSLSSLSLGGNKKGSDSTIKFVTSRWC